MDVDMIKSQVQKGILRLPLWKLKEHLISQKVLNSHPSSQESLSAPSKGWQQAPGPARGWPRWLL